MPIPIPKPIITLTTDFGTRDHFVAAIKGVILGIAPQAAVVDITHEVTPYELLEGAFTLWEAARFFPRGTIHVAVIDPGVGTRRRPILLEAGGQRFVGPDNGVFTLAAAADPKCRARELTAREYWRAEVSRTFHGRDIFAPVAAHLAAGVPPARLGKRIDDYLRLGAALAPVRTGKRMWAGSVLKVDRFGNLITNFRGDAFPDLGSRPFSMQVGLRQVAELVETFAHILPGEVALIAGGSGYLEVCANQDSASRLLGCGAGAPAELTLF